MSLKTLWLKIKGDNKGLKSSLKQSEDSVNKFGQTVKRLGTMIAAAFSVQVVARFAKEVIKLAGETEGVKRAFDKLNRPGLLDALRRATRGTVDDLTLMQKAVQAKNFKIPLDQLATYFEFATNRAIETGESVDYLVDSIITGIGRKSVLVMDNLGISAAELQEEVRKVGDFGAAAGVIIQRELEKAGEVADTTSIKIAQLSTVWQNFKAETGKRITESKGFQGALDWVKGFTDVLGKSEATFGQTLAAYLFKRKELTQDVEELEKAITEEYEKQSGELQKQQQLRQPTVTRQEAPGQIGGVGDIDTGALGIDTSYLREMGYASGLEWTDAFDVAAKESFARWSALDTLKAALQEAASMIVDSVEMIFESIGSGEFENLGNDLLTRFADFLSQLGKLMVAYGTAMLMFSILSKSPDPVSAGLAIGAGLAAIAIAGLIRGAASGAADGLSGGGSYGRSYGGATTGNISPLQGTVQVEGVLKGSDIVIASRRYTDKRNSIT